ncbi:hypothetical protein LSUB1_G008169 [Lachnellula subtilissima]|uniref:Uncharacterized protein n=1 Tax=Lachnellula subtilissima TaxID=602034 RepID=A0A8H8U6S9_9HELO|nr:hypothetical protein LSUB1_G008169 [Lachnellula subtilissima]
MVTPSTCCGKSGEGCVCTFPSSLYDDAKTFKQRQPSQMLLRREVSASLQLRQVCHREQGHWSSLLMP